MFIYIILIFLILVLVIKSARDKARDKARDSVISFEGKSISLIDATKNRYINNNNLYSLLGKTELQAKINIKNR